MDTFLLIFALYTIPAVSIDVFPSFSLARPATFRIRVIVPRHFDNRRICYSVDGPERKASCVDLAGWQSRRSWTVYWSLESAGDYTASAILTRLEDGREKTYRDDRPFRVIGSMGVD